MTTPPVVAIDLDGAIADTRPVWDAWLGSAGAVLGVDVSSLPADRGAAAALLDEHAGNWRTLLERFCEERVAVYVRRDPSVSDALRALEAAGREIQVFTDAPEPLARLVLAQVGADRRISGLAAGSDALARIRASSPTELEVVATREELAVAARTS